MARATIAHPSGLHMLMLIKRARDLRRASAVRVTAELCDGWPISRFTRQRIIAALEDHGLIVVEERRRGAAPLVRFADDVRFDAPGQRRPLSRPANGSMPPSESPDLSEELVR
jgi:DNA-binding transcriptional MocR family regulator